MTVRFYNNFNKKINSTKKPTLGGGAAFDVKLKDSSSILHPTFICSFPSAPSYNYIYVPTYNRFYYLVDWTYNQGLWTGEFTVDVLASWKSVIGATELYILRSSTKFNKYVADTKYPANEEILESSTQVQMPWVDVTNYNNYYVIISELMRPANFGGLAYQVLTASQATAFIRDLYDSWDSSITDPSPYLRNALLVPYRPTHTSGEVQVLSWGGKIPGQVGGGPALKKMYEEFTITINVPGKEHHGVWANWLLHEPFSIYELDINPWGVIPLDSYVLAQCDSITCEIKCDNFTGQALLRVIGRGEILYNGIAQVGTPIEIGGTTTNLGSLIGAIGKIGAFAATSGASALSSTVAGLALGWTGLSEGNTGSTGGTGGVIGLFNNCTLNWRHVNPTDDNKDNIGMPLCELNTPATLGGFMQAQNGLISINGSQTELNEINSFLTGGFYYE